MMAVLAASAMLQVEQVVLEVMVAQAARGGLLALMALAVKTGWALPVATEASA